MIGAWRIALDEDSPLAVLQRDAPLFLCDPLDRPAERERVTDAAYRLVTEGLPYDRTSRALLDAIEEKLRTRGATPSPAVA